MDGEEVCVQGCICFLLPFQFFDGYCSCIFTIFSCILTLCFSKNVLLNLGYPICQHIIVHYILCFYTICYILQIFTFFLFNLHIMQEYLLSVSTKRDRNQESPEIFKSAKDRVLRSEVLQRQERSEGRDPSPPLKLSSRIPPLGMEENMTRVYIFTLCVMLCTYYSSLQGWPPLTILE